MAGEGRYVPRGSRVCSSAWFLGECQRLILVEILWVEDSV